ncbi:MAG TPA: winged helix-turn-helix domain-containing protein [Vicinamibacteria bacterium]|nr:winged helix-turn-helix domain-containing protein [Vicinamibacteria bacterium]
MRADVENPVINLAQEADFELGVLRVRPSACEIVRAEGQLRVEPRVMQVLVSLHRRRGETVGRERLLEECWGDVVVSDDALVRSVSQLRKLVSNGDGGVRIETVPKVGYRLVVASGEFSLLPRSATLAVVVVLCVSLAWLIGYSRRPGSADVERLSSPVTSTPGIEQWPAISPSGGQVAYVRREVPGASRELYVQSIGSGSSLRLTDSAEDEHRPVWSPDGGRIAFVREAESESGIYVISPFGGAVARLVSCGSGEVLGIDWAPKGDRLAYTVREGSGSPGRAFLFDLATRERKSLPSPEDATASVEELAFGPDATTIAFTVSPALGVEDLYIHTFASGATTRVTHDHLKIHGFDWLPDGRGFVVSSNRGGEFALWRVARDGTGWTPVSGAVGGADEPRVSASGRLVYEAWRSSAEIWSARPGDGGATRLVPSTRYEWDASRSPDGRHITFISDRSGSAEVWTAGREGGDPTRLTGFGGAYTHTPRYSPDGLSIAFATPAAGNFDLYIVDVGAGESRRLTDAVADDFAPAWAPDGLSLYFGSTRNGAWQIWRLELETNRVDQITRDGGRVGQPSPDGSSLYFGKADTAGLWRLDLKAPHAREELVLDDLQPVDWNNWQVREKAIYYVRRPVPDEPEIARYDLETGRTTTWRREPRLLYKSGIWVAPDETEILFTRVGVSEADLMVIDSVTGS